MEPNQPEMLTVAETAKRLRISETTCYKAATLGELPFEKVLGQWRISRAYVDSLVGGPWRPRAHDPMPDYNPVAGYEPGMNGE